MSPLPYRPSTPKTPGAWVILLAQGLVVVLAVVLTGRLWFLQVPMGDYYHELAAENRVQDLIVPAARGEIVDAAGRRLVGNESNLVVSADFHALAEQNDGGVGVLTDLADVLDTEVEQLQQRTRLCGPDVERPCWAGSPYQPITLAEDVEPERVLRILERQEEFPGISAQQLWRRDYPHGEMAAQILGYLQPVTEDELEQREQLRTQFTGVDLVGRDGVEASYDEQLRGNAGLRRLAVDAAGNVTEVVEETMPDSGQTLVTTIDSQVQGVAEGALEAGLDRSRGQGYPADSGAVVVMDVTNGDVVAMASSPSYDPSVWDGGIDQETYDRLLSEHAGEPLTSRAVQGLYPPGSTFKPSTMSAAVEDGYDLHGNYPCPSSYQVGNRAFKNYESGSYGTISLHRALVVSCNTIFYKFGHEQWLQDGGSDPVDDPVDAEPTMARGFGFGSPTGIDLPDEPTGRIPDRTWKQEYWEQTKDQACENAESGYEGQANAGYLRQADREHCVDGYAWRAGDAANFAIGQGDVLVSPLQLAVAYSAIANGGTVYEPRVGKGFVSPSGDVETIEPEVAGEVPASDETLSYIRDALGDVTRSGTASGAFGDFPQNEVAVAGKTGTSTSVGRTESALFASYAPADDPRLAVVVVLSQGGTGGTYAAPVAAQVYEGIYGVGGANEAALPEGEPPTELPEMEPNGEVVPPEDVEP